MTIEWRTVASLPRNLAKSRNTMILIWHIKLVQFADIISVHDFLLIEKFKVQTF